MRVIIEQPPATLYPHDEGLLMRQEYTSNTIAFRGARVPSKNITGEPTGSPFHYPIFYPGELDNNEDFYDAPAAEVVPDAEAGYASYVVINATAHAGVIPDTLTHGGNTHAANVVSYDVTLSHYRATSNNMVIYPNYYLLINISLMRFHFHQEYISSLSFVVGVECSARVCPSGRFQGRSDSYYSRGQRRGHI